MKLLIIFIIASIINVIISTVKSIMTVKSGKWASALINATYYGFYTWVVMLMVCELDLWAKILITAVTNFIGVYVVKLIEEKARKDKLWRIECTAWCNDTESIHKALGRIPHNYIEDVGPWTIFNIYTQTKAQSEKVKEILSHYDVHYFVSESKTL
jgi:uncharacterized protein YebE (UPF0316 family)